MNRSIIICVVVLSIPLNGCITAYRMGYNRASEECIDAIGQGADLINKKIDAYKEKCERDRLELEACRETVRYK